MVWFDIETNPSPGCGWSGDRNSNCAYMAQLVQGARQAGVRAGVYSSQYMWDSIMGAGCTVASTLPLWYPHFDLDPSFRDFHPFGGWSRVRVRRWRRRRRRHRHAVTQPAISCATRAL